MLELQTSDSAQSLRRLLLLAHGSAGWRDRLEASAPGGLHTEAPHGCCESLFSKNRMLATRPQPGSNTQVYSGGQAGGSRGRGSMRSGAGGELETLAPVLIALTWQYLKQPQPT